MLFFFQNQISSFLTKKKKEKIWAGVLGLELVFLSFLTKNENLGRGSGPRAVFPPRSHSPII